MRKKGSTLVLQTAILIFLPLIAGVDHSSSNIPDMDELTSLGKYRVSY